MTQFHHHTAAAGKSPRANQLTNLHLQDKEAFVEVEGSQTVFQSPADVLYVVADSHANTAKGMGGHNSLVHSCLSQILA